MLYQACYVKVTACASTKFRFRLNEVHEEYKKDENNIQQAFVNFFFAWTRWVIPKNQDRFLFPFMMPAHGAEPAISYNSFFKATVW